MAIVEKNDWILIKKDDAKEEVIKWSQRWSKRTASYMATPLFVEGKEAANVLFVQSMRALEFVDLLVEVDSSNPLYNQGFRHKVQVTDAFQYGQNDDRTSRFLVFHHKDNKPYQHRFTNTNMFAESVKVIRDVAETLTVVPFVGTVAKIIDKVIDFGSSIFGDNLRDF